MTKVKRVLSIAWRAWAIACRIAIYPFAIFLTFSIITDRASDVSVIVWGGLILLVAGLMEKTFWQMKDLTRHLTNANVRTNEHLEKLDTHVRIIGPNGQIVISNDVHMLYYFAMQRDGRARYTFDGPVTLDVIRIVHPHVRSQAERLGRYIPPGYMERPPLIEDGSTAG